jgi:hypothetical protein
VQILMYQIFTFDRDWKKKLEYNETVNKLFVDFGKYCTVFS